MNGNILRILLKKEVAQIRRSFLMRYVIFVMPVLVMLVIPLVTTLDVKNVDVVVVDNDRTELSRRIVADMDAAECLSVVGCFFCYEEAFLRIEKSEADVIVTIPRNYLKDLVNGKKTELDVKANGVNATKGTLGARYVTTSMANTLSRWQAEQGVALNLPNPSVVNLYNQGLDFRSYMIPALMVVLLIIICGFLPTLNLVSEKETGTIEAMNVTPVGRWEFVLSKLIPYWVVALLVVTVGMLIGWLVYGVAPKGNIANVYLAAVLFSLIMSGLGVFIANKSATISQSIFVMFAFIIVFQLMGGLFTPVTSMPKWAQYITCAIPPRYFIEIMRSVYLKGATIADLWVQYAVLFGFAMMVCTAAALTYRKRA